MKKFSLSFAAVVVLCASSFTASAQVRSMAVSGTNPRPQAVSGTNPRPQAVSGTNPRPSFFGGVYSALLAYFGY